MIDFPQHDTPVQPRRIELPLGRVVATPGALEALTAAGQNPALLLNRHRSGDWGELDPDDRAANDAAVESGDRILSAYTLTNGTRLWVITEAGRQVTTLLLPDEY